ncbi:hypothetical protein [Deinococcus depolymerans]|uniref:Uncharacterized protein n=1 Tax=Deinococcus depolymerans TaxID=392408 RepID=A0ABP3MJB1_9DEIO
MKFRIPAAGLISLLLGAPAAGLGLGAPAGVFLNGPVTVTGARLLPGDRVATCLGARLVVLDATGAASRSVSTGAECAGLAVSPDGQLALTTTAAGNGTGVVSVWRLADGQRAAQWTVADLTGAGFNGPDTVLIGSARVTEQFSLTGSPRPPLTQPGVTFLTTSPDGSRAVVGRDRRVQLLDTRSAAVLSGYLCDEACPVGTVGFGADSRSAAVQAGRQLIALRENYPSSVVTRDTPHVAGLPLRDGTVLTLDGVPGNGELQRRDLLTGRREKTLSVPGGAIRPVQVTADQQVLGIAPDSLTIGPAEQPATRRLPLPARPVGGGLDPVTGRAAALLGNGTLLAGPTTAPQVRAVQTMNRATWTLSADSRGRLNLGQFSGGAVRTVAPAGTATHLSVNHWGNAAGIWNDDRLTVIGPAGQRLGTVDAPRLLAGARVTVSPDATRAFVVPAQGDAFVTLLGSGKRFPLPVAPGRRAGDVQISGRGVLAVTAADGTTDLYRPGVRVPFATLRAAAPRETLSGPRFSPDSTLLALPARDERGWRVDLVNAATGQLETRTPPLADPPSFLAWAADSRALTVGASLLDRLDSLSVFPLSGPVGPDH